MQMRAGYPASGANFANLCAGRYRFTFVHINFAQVTIQADESLPVIDDDGIAVEVIIAGRCDDSAHRRVDGCSGIGSDVHAFVWRARLIVEESPQTEAGTLSSANRCLQADVGQPRSPELNPVENVWQFMRDNWLSNRVFQTYDDILDNCCEAWNKLASQPWRIMSIGMRNWAHQF